ncbi:MAG: (2Fe-2S)-binding protein [bacterium]|nr:(2Fe-2S)-binding protein [bacterium]
MNTDDLRIGTIKRKEKVKLSVNGKKIPAYKGETILAALMAAGYKKMKKSPLNNEPRGALCGMGVCFECMVTVNGIRNTRSCMTEVENNMEIETDE